MPEIPYGVNNLAKLRKIIILALLERGSDYEFR